MRCEQFKSVLFIQHPVTQRPQLRSSWTFVSFHLGNRKFLERDSSGARKNVNGISILPLNNFPHTAYLKNGEEGKQKKFCDDMH